MTERAVHDAVYARLDDQLSVPVYDHAPQGAAFPYVTLSAQDVTELDTDDSSAATHEITLTVWSDHEGQQEVLDIIGAIHAALHLHEPALSDGTLVLMRVDDRRSVQDADGKTYMGSVVVTVIADR